MATLLRLLLLRRFHRRPLRLRVFTPARPAPLPCASPRLRSPRGLSPVLVAPRALLSFRRHWHTSTVYSRRLALRVKGRPVPAGCGPSATLVPATHPRHARAVGAYPAG